MDPGTVVGERFEIVRRAAVGGMGAVYAANDRTTGTLAAIKVVRIGLNEHIERLWLEARALAQLDHPAVVRYLAHGMTEGEAFIAMEWIEGETLSQRLKRQPLSVAESIALVVRAAEALGAAHAKGIVHRDVKPGNLVLRNNDASDVVLVDFGIARSHLREELTRTGTILGTPAFMSPEQARGAKRLEPASDVFALGCVLFRCLTGRNAFEADEPLAVVVKVLLDDPAPLSSIVDVDPELAQLMSRLLSKDATRRPQNGAAVAEALRQLTPRTTQDLRRAPRAPERITMTERRLVSLVLTEAMIDPEGTLSGDESGVLAHVRSAAARFGAACELLPNGLIVAALSGRSSATEQATLAARCALELKGRVGGAPLILVTGRATVDASDTASGVTHTRTDAFEAAARQIAALQQAKVRDCIVIDEATAGLLDRSFIVGPHDGGLELRGVRVGTGEAERLLGKAMACIGRERELATLDALLTECESEMVSRAAVVTAPPGTGKSRLLRELLSRASQRATAFHALADAFDAGSPYALLAQLLRMVAGIDGGDAEATRARKLRARIARHLPTNDTARVSEFLGEVAGIPMEPTPGARIVAARADPRLMAEQVRWAWAAWLSAECAVTPVLVVLDDIQWADPLTIMLISETLAMLPESRLCIVLGARPDVLDSFPKALGERAVSLSLGTLSRKASERLVRDALAGVADTVVTDIVARAGGHPLLLEELVRAHAQGHEDRGATAAIAMVQSRLESLDPECRRVLRAASILGEVFWRGAVEHLVSSNVGAQLDVAVSKELVAPRTSSRLAGEQELAFHHALVRDAAYAMLTPSDAALGHRLAGEWLEKKGSSAWILAEHFGRCDKPVRAVPHLRRAAEQALEAGDFAGAIACVARARSIGAGTEEAALLVVDADAKRWIGMMTAAEESALSAMKLGAVGSEAWLAAARIAVYCAGALVHVDSLHATTVQLLDIEPTPDTKRAWLLAAGQAMGVVHNVTFPPAIALRRRFEALALPSLDADPVVAMIHFHAMVSVAIYQADWTAVLAAASASVASAQRAGDSRFSVFMEVNVALALAELGDYEAAIETLGRARATAAQGSLRGAALAIEQNYGYILMCVGRLEEARRVEENVIREARDTAPRLHTASLACLTRVLIRLGDLDAALACAHEALGTAASADPIWRVYPLACLAEAHLARGDAAQALGVAQEARTTSAFTGGHHIGEAIAVLVVTEALRALGRIDEAKEEARQLRSSLKARANAVQDERRRYAMLHRVMDNRWAVELTAKLLD